MKLTERLYKSAENIWQGYHKHPFVCGIADGSLDIKKFRFFMVQDYLYLIEYAKVFALGVVKARDFDLMRMFATNVDNVLNGEMKLHREYMKRLGITEDEIAATAMSLTNRSYTEYMISVGFRGDALDILAAILACSWSYREIGCKIADENPAALGHEFYGTWVEGYSSSEYGEGNAALIKLTDSLSEGISEEQANRLVDIFVTCSRYEAMFWDMSWNKEL